MAAGNVLAAKAPAHLRTPARAVAAFGAVAGATEVFNWMSKNPRSRVSKLLARPGYELQHRLATAEPSPEQLEVAEAALAACVRLEEAANGSPH